MRASRTLFLFVFAILGVGIGGMARGQCAHGDSDGSAVVDLSDYSAFVDCASTPPGEPLGIECGPVDFDGDDDVDVRDYGRFQDLSGVTLGVLFENREFGVGRSPSSVAVGDLDGDGDLDLAVANQRDDSVSILLNLGDGTFADDVFYWAGDGPWSVAVGDLDGDRDLDLAVAAGYGNDV